MTETMFNALPLARGAARHGDIVAGKYAGTWVIGIVDGSSRHPCISGVEVTLLRSYRGRANPGIYVAHSEWREYRVIATRPEVPADLHRAACTGHDGSGLVLLDWLVERGRG